MTLSTPLTDVLSMLCEIESGKMIVKQCCIIENEINFIYSVVLQKHIYSRHREVKSQRNIILVDG